MPMSSDALSSDAREIDDGFENIRAVYYNKNKATQPQPKAIIHLYMESAGEMNKNEQESQDKANNEYDGPKITSKNHMSDWNKCKYSANQFYAIRQIDVHVRTDSQGKKPM